LRRRGSRLTPFFGDARDHRIDGDRFAFFDKDLLKNACGGGGNFGVYLVGGDLKKRLVALNALAGFLQPLGESSFYDAFAHLGHWDVNHVVLSVANCFENSRVSAACTSALEAVEPRAFMEVTGFVSPQGTMY
jgi:hypothetical protein